VNGIITICMAMGSTSGQMDQTMTAITSMIKERASVRLLGVMGVNMKASGKKAKCMVRVPTRSLVVSRQLVYGLRVIGRT
jgi:hypothetical protein